MDWTKSIVTEMNTGEHEQETEEEMEARISKEEDEYTNDHD